MKKGDFARIQFWDHCQGGPPLKCQVVGELVEVTDDHYLVTCWQTDGDDPDNQTEFGIVRSAIIKEKRLK